MRALDGVRVIDLGHYVAAPLATMILADHGADVIRIDPPGGPRWDSDANAVLQRGKRSIVLDLKQADGQAIAQRLVARADVVVDGFRPGVLNRLGLSPLDHNVWCSLPGFASDDPRAAMAGWEGIVGAATGHYTTLPMEQRDRPNFSALPVASTFAALIAVNSILAALIARHRTGLGQHIEVPLFGAMFEAIGSLGQQLPTPPAVPFTPCSDIDAQGSDGRWIHIVMISPRHYAWFRDAFLPYLGPPDLDSRERIVSLIGTAPAAEWDRLINAAGIPCCVVNSTEQWLREDEHADASRAVIELDDPYLGRTRQLGCGVQLSDSPPSASPRHLVDADRDDILAELDRPAAPTPTPTGVKLAGALDGIQVIDTTMILAGPSAGRILAEFGADVIKVNRPAYWIIGHCHTNSGKRTTLIDLAEAAGREVLWSLVSNADVFLQNLPEGKADEIGIGEQHVRAHQANIVYSSVSAYGKGGPRSRYRGWEPIGQAATGMMLRYGGGVPRFGRFGSCDYGAGHLSAMAVLLGLLHRARSLRAQHVSTSLVQAGAHHQAPFMLWYEGKTWDEPAGPDVLGWGSAYRLYEASDGWLFAVGDDLPDPETFRTATVDHWTTRLQNAHRLVDIEDLMGDPYVREAGLCVTRDHPGIGRVRLVGPCPRLSRTPVRITDPAAAPGWHTREVVGDRFDQLAAAGVVADSLPHDVMLVL